MFRLYWLSSPRKCPTRSVRADLSNLVLEFGAIPVVVVANSDEPVEILAALEIGVRGYVPTSVKARVVAEAIELARAGGTFVPVSGFLALRDVICGRAANERQMPSIFTTRQGEVAEALRKGKANKIIAYELNMCESTVKVHVRNIMKKVQATNRTQVAYKLSEMGISAASPPNRSLWCSVWSATGWRRRRITTALFTHMGSQIRRRSGSRRST